MRLSTTSFSFEVHDHPRQDVRIISHVTKSSIAVVTQESTYSPRLMTVSNMPLVARANCFSAADCACPILRAQHLEIGLDRDAATLASLLQLNSVAHLAPFFWIGLLPGFVPLSNFMSVCGDPSTPISAT